MPPYVVYAHMCVCVQVAGVDLESKHCLSQGPGPGKPSQPTPRLGPTSPSNARAPSSVGEHLQPRAPARTLTFPEKAPWGLHGKAFQETFYGKREEVWGIIETPQAKEWAEA